MKFELVVVVLLGSAAARAAPGLDGCDDVVSPLQEALGRAEQALQAGETQAVRDQVARVQREGASSPYFLMRAGGLLEGLGDQAGAAAAYEQALQAAKQPQADGDANTGKLYQAAALSHLHRGPEAAPLIAAVPAEPRALLVALRSRRRV